MISNAIVIASETYFRIPCLLFAIYQVQNGHKMDTKTRKSHHKGYSRPLNCSFEYSLPTPLNTSAAVRTEAVDRDNQAEIRAVVHIVAGHSSQTLGCSVGKEQSHTPVVVRSCKARVSHIPGPVGYSRRTGLGEVAVHSLQALGCAGGKQGCTAVAGRDCMVRMSRIPVLTDHSRRTGQEEAQEEHQMGHYPSRPWYRTRNR
jgi:hypothetical protein